MLMRTEILTLTVIRTAALPSSCAEHLSHLGGMTQHLECKCVTIVPRVRAPRLIREHPAIAVAGAGVVAGVVAGVAVSEVAGVVADAATTMRI